MQESIGQIELSIIIVSYNARKYLEGCLRSIQEHVSVSHEVILVDNGSQDDTCFLISNQFPWVILIPSKKNLGFTAGNNLGVSKARGKYLLLLNADTVLLSDISPAILLLKNNVQIGIVGGRMFRANGRSGISTGHFPSAFRLWLFKSIWMKPKAGYFDLPALKADWVEGAFLMTTAENWRALGGLDEYYFLCADDMDFCRATSGRGLAVVQSPNVKYIHFGGHTVGRMTYLYAGFRHYHKKFSGSVERRLAEAVLRLGLVFRIAAFGTCYFVTRSARAGEKWRSFIEVHRTWAQMNP